MTEVLVKNESNINQQISAYTPYDITTSFPQYEGKNRYERAQAILKNPRNIKKVGKNTYTVKSQFSFGTYVVTNAKDEHTNETVWKCTCPDFMNNGHICKLVVSSIGVCVIMLYILIKYISAHKLPNLHINYRICT